MRLKTPRYEIDPRLSYILHTCVCFGESCAHIILTYCGETTERLMKRPRHGLELECAHLTLIINKYAYKITSSLGVVEREVIVVPGVKLPRVVVVVVP